jgi:glycosyltransferase involved in cell wall biosynthesis
LISKRKVRIAINAQLPRDGGSGGTETVLTALATMARLNARNEEHVFVGPATDTEWLRPWLGPDQEIVPGPPPVVEDSKPETGERLKRALGPLRAFARTVKQRFAPTPRTAESNFYERLGCDVVHFPFQYHESCRMPTVFNPHDLQHKHFPSFFDDAEIKRRDEQYAQACRSAFTVVVASHAVKRDLQQFYDIDASKIEVIPWSPPPMPQEFQPTEESFRSVREKYRLTDESFALYPAMTWEHKNHLRLLEALALLRERDQKKIRVVCTGQKKDFWPVIEKQVHALGLESQISFLGMVPFSDLCALYRRAEFAVIPSMFEAASAPLFEAWQHDLPVACSRIESLTEQASDAAYFFDPLSVSSIADALLLMSTDGAMRGSLKVQGARRLEYFSLERMAEAYGRVYARAASAYRNIAKNL